MSRAAEEGYPGALFSKPVFSAARLFCFYGCRDAEQVYSRRQ